MLARPAELINANRSPIHRKGSHGLPTRSPVQRKHDFGLRRTGHSRKQYTANKPIAEVDGHDIGSGEINIFILTVDPVATFERAKPLLSAASILYKVVSAYRDLRCDKYIVVWPKNSTEAFTIA